MECVFNPDIFTITIYQKSYINVQIDDKVITIEILKDPYRNEKFVSTGVSIYMYNVDPICKIRMDFDICLDTEEEVYLRLYTGIKWIIYDDFVLTTEPKQITLSEDFNLENSSKWRLTTTSRKIGQKITIKNFKFCLDK